MEQINMSLIERALKVAVVAHAGQVRKSDGSPYIVHPVMVARMLDRAGFSEEVVAAALVHDVLEDTDVTEAELRAALGDAVVDIVFGVSEQTELPWEERKQKYIERVASSGEAVMAVSVADKIHNAESLLDAAASMGSRVWEVFNRGKEKKLWFEESLYAALVPKFQHPILAQYRTLIDAMAKIPE
jgi:(p)ppGpp synthase/HD superfamily hydrolase